MATANILQVGKGKIPRYIQRFKPYLQNLLQKSGYAACAIQAVEELPRRGRAGHPIVKLDASWGGGATSFSLHFRQMVRTVEVETDALARARLQGVNVPRVVFAAKDCDNEFGTPFLIREYVRGVSLDSNPEFVDSHLPELIDSLLRIHQPQPGSFGPPSRSPIEVYRKQCRDSTGLKDIVEREELLARFDIVLQYHQQHAHVLTIPWRSLIHGELHPTKILIGEDGRFCFVNWELSRYGDYCADLAFMRLTLFDQFSSDPERQFASVISCYREAHCDMSIEERLKFYMGEACLYYLARNAGPFTSERRVRHLLGKLDQLRAYSGPSGPLIPVSSGPPIPPACGPPVPVGCGSSFPARAERWIQ